MWLLLLAIYRLILPLSNSPLFLSTLPPAVEESSPSLVLLLISLMSFPKHTSQDASLVNVRTSSCSATKQIIKTHESTEQCLWFDCTIWNISSIQTYSSSPGPPPSNMFSPPLYVLHHPSLPPPTTAGSVSTMESRPDLSSPHRAVRPCWPP